MIARVGERREGNRGGAPAGKEYHTQESQMRAWNGRAFAAVALIVGATCLASVVHYAGETNHRGFVSSAHAQPEPIRRLIDWLRGLTMPAGIVKAEGRIEATQVDVSSKYAGEVVDVAVQEGDKVAAGQVIARLSLAAARGAIAKRGIRTPDPPRRRGRRTPSKRRRPKSSRSSR